MVLYKLLWNLCADLGGKGVLDHSFTEAAILFPVVCRLKSKLKSKANSRKIFLVTEFLSTLGLESLLILKVSFSWLKKMNWSQ